MYTVIYRTGGYLNAKWHAALPIATSRTDEAMQIARSQARAVEKMGYKAIIHKTASFEKIGLPVGYCSKCNSVTGECQKQNDYCRDI